MHAVRASRARPPFTGFSTGGTPCPHHAPAAGSRTACSGLGPSVRRAFARRSSDLGASRRRRTDRRTRRCLPRLGRRSGTSSVVPTPARWRSTQVSPRTPDYNAGRVIDAAIDGTSVSLDNTLISGPGVVHKRSQHGGHDHRILQRSDDAERHSADRRMQPQLAERFWRIEGWGNQITGALLGRLGGRATHLQVGKAGWLTPGTPGTRSGPLVALTDKRPRAATRGPVHHVTDIGPTILKSQEFHTAASTESNRNRCTAELRSPTRPIPKPPNTTLQQ